MEYGTVTVKDFGVEVLDADPIIGISLDLLASADPRWLRARGNEITFGRGKSAVDYTVFDWDGLAGMLICHRLTPAPAPAPVLVVESVVMPVECGSVFNGRSCTKKPEHAGSHYGDPVWWTNELGGHRG